MLFNQLLDMPQLKKKKIYTVRSVIISSLDKDEKKRQYKINNTSTELYCMHIFGVENVFYTNAIAQI
jgi:hypothetical protein